MVDTTGTAMRRIPIETAIGDVEAAIARHIASRIVDPEDARRSIDAALEAIYRVSNVLKDAHPDFWDTADQTVEGRTMQAVVYMRGRVTHRLLETHEPEILIPGVGLYPSEDLYPDVNYYWVIWPEMAGEMEPVNKHDKRDLVNSLMRLGPARHALSADEPSTGLLSGPIRPAEGSPLRGSLPIRNRSKQRMRTRLPTPLLGHRR